MGDLEYSLLKERYEARGIMVFNFRTREEWLRFRKSRIGGSDASCVMGLNPWKSNLDLWLEKTGKKIADNLDDNELVQYGHKAEEFIRSLFAIDHPEYRVVDGTDIILVNHKYPWAHASLDGHLLDAGTDNLELAGILEIKTVNAVNNDVWKKWRDRIPDYYYCQVLHYLAVTELPKAILRAQIKTVNDDGTVYAQMREYVFNRAEIEADITTLMDAEKAFYESLKSGEEPSVILPQI